LQIEYKNRRLEKVCTDAHEAEVKHGKNMAEKIHQRIDEITAADSIEILVK
jgi:toxin HigB-1